MEKLDKIEKKLDVVIDRIGSIDVTLAKQHVSLTEHMRRTELLESDIAPIKKHVAMVHGALKLIGLVAVVIGAIEGIVAIIAAVR